MNPPVAVNPQLLALRERIDAGMVSMTVLDPASLAEAKGMLA